MTAYVLKLIDEKRDIKFVKSINKKLIKADPGLIKFLYPNEKLEQKEQKKNSRSNEVKQGRKIDSSKKRGEKKVTIYSKSKFKDLKTIYNKLENKDTKTIARLLGAEHSAVIAVFEFFNVNCKEPISYKEFIKAKDWLLTLYDRKLISEGKIKVYHITKAKKTLKAKRSSSSSSKRSSSSSSKRSSSSSSKRSSSSSSKRSSSSSSKRSSSSSSKRSSSSSSKGSSSESWGDNFYKFPRIKFISTGMKS